MNRPTVSVRTEVSAPVQRVWRFASDITLMPGFSDELQTVEWVDGDAPRLGARFLGTNTHPMVGTWTTQSCVVDFDPPRVFGWAVGNLDAPAATMLRYTAVIGPGPSGVTMMIEREPHRREQIVSNRLRSFEQAMTATVAGIKQLAESTAR